VLALARTPPLTVIVSRAKPALSRQLPERTMISRQFWVGLVILLLAATNLTGARAVALGGAPPSAGDEWTVEPGVRIGVITRQTTEAELVKLLGKRNVRRAKIDIGEGATRTGTLVLPGTAEEVKLFWKRDAYRLPEYGVITRISAEPTPDWWKPTRWHTPDGITIGTKLAELVRLNGRDFRLHGLAWDHSGTVNSWNEGALSRYGKHFIVRLGPMVNLDTLSRDEAGTVEGSGVIVSSVPALAKLDLRVYEIVVGLGGAVVSEFTPTERLTSAFSRQPSAAADAGRSTDLGCLEKSL